MLFPSIKKICEILKSKELLVAQHNNTTVLVNNKMTTVLQSWSAAAEFWIQHDPNPLTRATIEKLYNDAVANDDQDEPKRSTRDKLHTLLSTRLAFGTAGLRGPMGPGVRCSNVVRLIIVTLLLFIRTSLIRVLCHHSFQKQT